MAPSYLARRGGRSRTARACMTLPGPSTRTLSSRSSLTVLIRRNSNRQHGSGRRPIILSVGRVVYQKGYDVALDALFGLKDLEWEWHIVGDGPHLHALRTLLEKYRVGRPRAFHGMGGGRSGQIGICAGKPVSASIQA